MKKLREIFIKTNLHFLNRCFFFLYIRMEPKNIENLIKEGEKDFKMALEANLD